MQTTGIERTTITGLVVEVAGGGVLELSTDVLLTANNCWPLGVSARSLTPPKKRESPAGADHDPVRLDVHPDGGDGGGKDSANMALTAVPLPLRAPPT